MSKITIEDLEVFYRVGVTEQERTHPQRLLLTLEIERDFGAAVASDDLQNTIDYHAVAQDLLALGQQRAWNLIEKVAADLAEMVLLRYKPQSVGVTVKKFALPQARHVSVSLALPARQEPGRAALAT
jgi:7,8-dihydroneopterin aldolase/epimerase/oxygenase